MIGVDTKLGRNINGNSNLTKVLQVVNENRPKLPPSFFKPDEDDQMSLDWLKDMRAIHVLAGLKGDSFLGWAVLSVDRLQTEGFEPILSPQKDNKYHAHVMLPGWEDYGRKQTYILRLTRCIASYQAP